MKPSWGRSIPRLSCSRPTVPSSCTSPSSTARHNWSGDHSIPTTRSPPGTEGAFSPTFSPDGRWVAFLTDGELKKVPLDGGEPVVLCEAHVSMSATWSRDGHVYFTHHEVWLARVDETGGPIEDLGLSPVHSVHAMPDGGGVLLNFGSEFSFGKDNAGIWYVDGAGKVTPIHVGSYMPSYVSGHLLFICGGSLYTMPVDPETLAPTGAPVRAIGGVSTDSIWSGAACDVSLDGTLVYLPGYDGAQTRPTWIDRDGNLEPLELPDQVYNAFQLSEDRTKLAIQVVGAKDQVHVYDFERKTFDRLTTLGGRNGFPVWKNDDQRVVFGNVDGNLEALVSRIFSQPIDGSGNAEPILTEAQQGLLPAPVVGPLAVSPDGKTLLFFIVTDDNSYDIWMAPLNGSGDPQPFIETEASEILASFSWDGRWIVYESDRTGRYEIYVRPFPDVDRREWRISSGGGDDARWSPATNELFYRRGSHLDSVSFTTDPDFEPAEPKLILTTNFHNSAGFSFDLSADGQRFLINRPVGADDPNPPLHVIQNWAAELE